MARSSKKDAYDKFRFKVVFFDFQTNIDNTSNLNENNNISSGFNEVITPKVNITERTYRENTDPIRKTKAAGLASYEPITLRKGKTESRAIYNWYKLVNDDSNSLGAANRLLGTQNITPVYSLEYRKDLVIGLLDRNGDVLKAWFVFNAFPISYSGTTQLTASEDGKAIEELVLSYESFVELNEDSITTLQQETVAAARAALTSATVNTLTTGSLPF